LSAQATLLAGQRSLIELQRQQLVAVNALLKNLGGDWALTP
jgi:outer membrane protein TolC